MPESNDTFNYLAVLFSVVLGLAATEILQGIRRLLIARQRVVLHWPALFWAGTLLLVLAQTWWAMFGLRSHTDWTFGMYAVVLLQVVLLYMASGLVLPESSAKSEVRMRDSYFSHLTPFFLFLLAATGASLLKDVVISGRLTEPANLMFHAIFAAVAVLALLTRRDVVHTALAAGIFLAFVGYILLLFDRLPG